MTYEIKENRNYGSREVYFDGKPSEEVRNALKLLKMRWNHKKMCWYGYAGENELINAIISAGAIQEDEGNTVVTDGYLGGGAVYGSKSNSHLYGADLAKAFREDLKKAGIKGVTVRSGKSTYTDSFTITVTIETSDINKNYTIPQYKILDDLGRGGVYDGKEWRYLHQLTPDENGSYIDTPEFEEIRAAAIKWEKNRYSKGQQINHYYIDRYEEFTEEFRKKLHTIKSIINAYHWDESNSMVDYFSTNFYLDIDTKPGKSWATVAAV